MIELGGDKAWKVSQHGDLIRSFQYLGDEPAMFIFKKNTRRGGAVVVRLQDAYKWGRPDGYADTEYAIPAAFDALGTLGSFPSSSAAFALIDAVIDGLSDLIAMPPKPAHLAEKPTAKGEVTLKIDGETILEAEAAA